MIKKIVLLLLLSTSILFAQQYFLYNCSINLKLTKSTLDGFLFDTLEITNYDCGNITTDIILSNVSDQINYVIDEHNYPIPFYQNESSLILYNVYLPNSTTINLYLSTYDFLICTSCFDCTSKLNYYDVNKVILVKNITDFDSNQTLNFINLTFNNSQLYILNDCITLTYNYDQKNQEYIFEINNSCSTMTSDIVFTNFTLLEIPILFYSENGTKYYFDYVNDTLYVYNVLLFSGLNKFYLKLYNPKACIEIKNQKNKSFYLYGNTITKKLYNVSIYLVNSSNISIIGEGKILNYRIGILLDNVYNSTVSDIMFYSDLTPIFLNKSKYNTIKNNIFYNLNLINISFINSDKNIIYNNLFNTSKYQLIVINSENYWNTTRMSGINIVGNNILGGNYWGKTDGTGYSDTCDDVDQDGICDFPYNLTKNNVDYLPLSKGSTRIIPPANTCYCNSCSDCTNKLMDPNCKVVYLNNSIVSTSNVCIDASSVSYKSFVCNKNVIRNGLSYSLSNTIGIKISNSDYFYLGECYISGFDTNVYVDSSDYVTIERNVLKNNVGIYLDNVFDSKITSNIINDVRYGIKINGKNNLIYNNLINISKRYLSPKYVVIINDLPNNWNTTRLPGINIVGKNILGGNYYATSDKTGYSDTCNDSDQDGICDIPLNFSNNNIDYLPLSKNQRFVLSSGCYAYSISITNRTLEYSVTYTCSTPRNVIIELYNDYVPWRKPLDVHNVYLDYLKTVTFKKELPDRFLGKTDFNIVIKDAKTNDTLFVSPDNILFVPPKASVSQSYLVVIFSILLIIVYMYYRKK